MNEWTNGWSGACLCPAPKLPVAPRPGGPAGVGEMRASTPGHELQAPPTAAGRSQPVPGGKATSGRRPTLAHARRPGTDASRRSLPPPSPSNGWKRCWQPRQREHRTEGLSPELRRQCDGKSGVSIYDQTLKGRRPKWGFAARLPRSTQAGPGPLRRDGCSEVSWKGDWETLESDHGGGKDTLEHRYLGGWFLEVIIGEGRYREREDTEGMKDPKVWKGARWGEKSSWQGREGTGTARQWREGRGDT